jgi:hypothetical protein
VIGGFGRDLPPFWTFAFNGVLWVLSLPRLRVLKERALLAVKLAENADGSFLFKHTATLSLPLPSRFGVS